MPLTCSCDITYHLIIIIYLPLKIQMREMVLKPCCVNRTRHLPSMCTIYDYVISTWDSPLIKMKKNQLTAGGGVRCGSSKWRGAAAALQVKKYFQIYSYGETRRQTRCRFAWVSHKFCHYRVSTLLDSGWRLEESVLLPYLGRHPIWWSENCILRNVQHLDR